MNYFLREIERSLLTIVYVQFIYQTEPTNKPLEELSITEPKQETNESEELAAKYGNMSLEDRAFAILNDLGMIEIHKPIDIALLPTISKEINDENDDNAKEATTTDEPTLADTTKDDEESPSKPSKRERFLYKPIRSIRSKICSHNDEKIPNKLLQDRHQPKSTQEESRLAAKYASIPSLEDRAYAILIDLGMIEGI